MVKKAKKKAKKNTPAWYCDIQYTTVKSKKEQEELKKKHAKESKQLWDSVKKREKQLDTIIKLLKQLIKKKGK